ncbi:MAG TPA: sugar ABC transporter substrate-binding protein [Chloroflexota bacterium]|nr:sugar ABC transporter substrate-binding protein [Chloroflexota bacterium]
MSVTLRAAAPVPALRAAVTRRRAAALAGGVAPLLVACAGPAGGPAGQPAPSAGKQAVTLRWSPYDGEGQAIVDGANKGTELYTKQHPNVTVQISPEIYDSFGAKIDTMIAAGDAPDVFGGNGAAWRDRALRGQFLGLDPLIKRDFKANQIEDYVASHYKAFNLKETGQFSLPMYLGTMALYYNKAWFRERGVAFPDDTWDWNKWADAMRRLTVAPDRFGAELLTLSRSRALMLILQNGGHLVDPRDDTLCVVDQPPALEALQWINERAWKDHTAVQNPEAATLGQNVTQRFSSGKVATFIEGSWRLAPMALEVQPGLEWDVAPLPKGKVKRSTRATTDGWAIWQGSKQPDAAWEFMRWLQGDDWYEIMMSVVGLTPARLSKQDKWVSLIAKAYPQLASKNLKAFTDAVKQRYAEPEEFFRFHKDATDILDPAYNDTVRDNKENVSTTFKEVAKRVTDVQKQRAGG